MIDREHKVSITRQDELVGISRGSVYYQPRPVSSADLALMRRIDELHLEFPFMGARALRFLWGQSYLGDGRMSFVNSLQTFRSRTVLSYVGILNLHIFLYRVFRPMCNIFAASFLLFPTKLRTF